MRAQKVVRHSAVLGRRFHIDRVDGAGDPKCVILFFGGSGVSSTEYDARLETLHPAIAAFADETEVENLVLVYVTAPPDVPYAHFARAESAQIGDDARERLYAAIDRWNEHVTREILPLVPPSRICLAAHSGGVALAWNGLHDLEVCRALFALGADGLVGGMSRGQAWEGPARLYYNRGDGVRKKNQHALAALAAQETVQIVEAGGTAAGHELEAYVASGAMRTLALSAVGRR